MKNTPFLKAMFAVLRKDLSAELRSRELISSMALFALLSVLIFSFGLQLSLQVRKEAISGVMWVTVLYAVVLGFNRNSTVEREGGSFEAMLLTPVSRGAIYIGKVLGNYIFAVIVGALLLPLMTILYNVPLTHWGVFLVLLLGGLGLSATGTLLSIMTVQTRTRETLLPIVMLPVALPLLLIAVNAVNRIVAGAETGDWLGWVQILAVLDVIYCLLCYLLFEYVIED